MEALIVPILCFAVINLAIILLGYIFIKHNLLWQSWLMLITGILIIYLIFIHAHPIIKMLAIIATTFMGMKVVAVAQRYHGKPLTLKFNQWLAFAIGWAGMRAQPFERLGQPALPNAREMILFGISRVIAGGLLIALAHYIVLLPVDPSLIKVGVSIMLLIALSLILHFGLLSISAGTWRLSGVNTYLLFKQPARATSLTQFWSKRWNLAFSEMTSITIFRPLKAKIGNAGALMLAFGFSGLLHELALSLPVNSGYGLPLLYFIIQGTLVLVEKVLINNQVAFLQHQVWGRVWTFFWLAVPMPLLFHTEFIKQIVWPLVGLKF